MKLYYSVDFKESIITHHGESDYPLNVYPNSEPQIESMIAFVKADLTKSIKKWGFTPDDMVTAECYFFRGSEEKRFFSWEKEDLIENK